MGALLLGGGLVQGGGGGGGWGQQGRALRRYGALKYASTFRLPPQRAQANTSSANVLRSSPAQSTRGVRSFFGSSIVTAKDGLSSCGSAPA